MRLEVKVIPGARKEWARQEGGVLKIYLNAPAVDGKANEALTAFLAHRYGVRKRQIEITKGLKSRHKIIMIKDI